MPSARSPGAREGEYANVEYAAAGVHAAAGVCGEPDLAADGSRAD